MLKDIRKLHESGLKIGVTVDVLNRIYYLWERVKEQKIVSKENENIKKHFGIIERMLSETELKICHGDFHHGNIVKYNHKIQIIDWETMCMSDPMYDICRFLFYYCREKKKPPFEELEYFLTLYYSKRPCKKEYEHAYAMLTYCEYVEFLLQLVNDRKNNVDLYKDIIKRLKIVEQEDAE